MRMLSDVNLISLKCLYNHTFSSSFFSIRAPAHKYSSHKRTIADCVWPIFALLESHYNFITLALIQILGRKYLDTNKLHGSSVSCANKGDSQAPSVISTELSSPGPRLERKVLNHEIWDNGKRYRL